MIDKPLILVSGPPASGKTTLSEIVAECFGYRCANIGDALLARIPHNTGPFARTEIGRRFLQVFSLGKYYAVLEELARPSTVLDGVRLATGVEHLREKCPELIHIHREFPDQQHINTSVACDSFEDEISRLRVLADLVVPWLPEVSLLSDVVDTEFKPLFADRLRT